MAQIFTQLFVKRFALCYQTVICPVLFVTLVYTVAKRFGWIRMPLDMEEGLGPGHIVLDEDPATPAQKGHTPQFLPVSVVAKRPD